MLATFAVLRVLGKRTVRGVELKGSFSVIHGDMGELRVNKYELEEHLSHISLQARQDIPMVPLPTSVFSLTFQSIEEVRQAKLGTVRHHGTMEFPIFCTKMPESAVLLHSLIESS